MCDCPKIKNCFGGTNRIICRLQFKRTKEHGFLKQLYKSYPDYFPEENKDD